MLAQRRVRPLIAALCRSRAPATGSSVCRRHSRRWLSISRQSDGSYGIPEERLNELMAREVTHLASKPIESFRLQRLIDISVEELAEVCRVEGPKRLALRIRLLEGLPGMKNIPELVKMHEMLSRWYKALRLLPSNVDPEDLLQCLRGIRKEGLGVVPLVAAGIHKLQKHSPSEFGDDVLDKWLDGFFLSRISTNALGDQFVSRLMGRPMGIIDTQCDATAVCTKAAEVAAQLCKQCTGREPSYVINNYKAGQNEPVDSHCFLSYIPSYLHYTIFELLKNSFKATVDSASNQADVRNHPVHVRICRDKDNVAILVSDSAGGIPLEVGDRVFSYLYGAAAREDVTSNSTTPGATPLAGFGVGLPIARLHTRYLGGSLNLTSYPGYGTQAHVLLPRIDTKQIEVLPQESWVPLS